MYDVIFDKKALEFLKKLDYKTKNRIFNKIISTKEKPFRYFEKLTKRNEYKIRIGNYRVIVDIDEKTKKIKVLFFGHRKNIYKNY